MITATYDFVCRFLSFIKVDVDSEPGDVNILALKGIVPTSYTGVVGRLYNGTNLMMGSDASDRYNDTFLAAWKDLGGNKSVTIAIGTVDPGRYYTVDDPNPQGAAHLTFGQHLYVPGDHKGQPAFRALNELNRVWRDKNGNFMPDVGEVVHTGQYGTNLHAGGRSANIGKYSAGCLNIAGGVEGVPWQTFLELRDLHFVGRPNKKPFVRVNLWRGQDAINLAQGKVFKPTLVMGIKNQWVAEMQAGLAKKGLYGGAVDGDWGVGTTAAVVALQKAANLKPDGLCGPLTWAALG